jgi:hypothetical protein
LYFLQTQSQNFTDKGCISSTPPKPSTLALESAQAPVNEHRGYFLEKNGRSVKFVTNLHLLTRLTMSGDTHVFQIRAFRCRKEQIYLYRDLLHETKDVQKHGIPKIFLRAFSKLRKETLSFVMSVCPHVTTLLPLDGFS